tara:strand:- start:1007 stop:1603 length:597 start_codon:yes stop_codon:yes gene_type:complete
MEIILATRNVSKAAQIKDVFAGTPINVLTLDEVGIEGEAVEDGSTLEENAFKKIGHAAAQRPGSWIIADDTGIFIDALDGQPGIRAARWAGDVSTEEIMNFTLGKLDGIPFEKRTATFRTLAAVIDPDGNRYTFVGELPGNILEAPAKECQPHMPYSAIFMPDGHDKTWAEMSITEENAISHRGKAFGAAREFLVTQI